MRGVDHIDVNETGAPPPPGSRPDGRPASAAPRRADPGLAAVHGLWAGAVLGAVVLAVVGAVLGAADGLGGSLATMVVLSAWLGLVWVPVTAAWGGVAGLAGGLAARWTDRHTGSLPAGPVVVAAAAGAAVGGVGTLLLDVTRAMPYTAAAVVGGALVAAVAVLVERRGARSAAQRGRPRRGGVPVAATAVLGAVAWLWTGWVALRAEPWDWGETCGPLLGWQSEEVGFASGGFPRQGWCLGGTSRVEPTQPVWHAVLASVLVTAAVAALTVLVAQRLGASRSRWGRAVAGGVLAVVVAAGAVWAAATATAGPSDEDWQELAQRRTAAAAADQSGSAAPPTSSAAGSSTATPAPPAPSPSAPAVSGAAARADLEVLRVAAQDAGGPDLLWPRRLTVEEATCAAPDGAPGVRHSLTGRFTTRDLASASDNLDFLSITQANEEVAARIADAWSRDGLGTPEPLHGEWWQGPAPDGRTTVETAHVGFEEGVGVVQVDSVCATLPS